jgi:hypothetical protein
MEQLQKQAEDTMHMGTLLFNASQKIGKAMM